MEVFPFAVAFIVACIVSSADIAQSQDIVVSGEGSFRVYAADGENVSSVVCLSERFVQTNKSGEHAVPLVTSGAMRVRGYAYQIEERSPPMGQIAYRLFVFGLSRGNLDFRCGKATVIIQRGVPVTQIVLGNGGQDGLVAGSHVFNEGDVIPPFRCAAGHAAPDDHILNVSISFDNGSSLFFHPVRPTFVYNIPSNRHSSGRYECTAANRFNTDPVTARVDLQVRFGPDFSSTPAALSLNHGQAANITCSVSAFPAVTLLTGRLPNSDQPVQLLPRLISGGSVPTSVHHAILLQVQSVTPQHAGQYSCTASNGVGSSTHVISVTVRTAPPSQPRRLRVIGKSSTYLTLTWEMPSENRGSAVSGYNINCSSKEGTVAMTTASAANRIANISGLSPGLTYSCRVTAGNSAGHSTPAVLTTRLLAISPCPPTVQQPVASRRDQLGAGVHFDVLIPCDGGDTLECTLIRTPRPAQGSIRPLNCTAGENFTVSDLMVSAGTTYVYHLNVVNSAGFSSTTFNLTSSGLTIGTNRLGKFDIRIAIGLGVGGFALGFLITGLIACKVLRSHPHRKSSDRRLLTDHITSIRTLTPDSPSHRATGAMPRVTVHPAETIQPTPAMSFGAQHSTDGSPPHSQDPVSPRADRRSEVGQSGASAPASPGSPRHDSSQVVASPAIPPSFTFVPPTTAAPNADYSSLDPNSRANRPGNPYSDDPRQAP